MSRFDVKNFISPPDPELLCGVCMNVLDKPKETPCRHVFCEVCITRALETQNKCPMCRAKCKVQDLKGVLPLVENLLNKLLMRCQNHRGGSSENSCNETIKKEFYFSHLKKCDYGYIDCRNKGCKAAILRKDKLAHKETCIYRKVICPKGCFTTYRWKDRKTHNCLKSLKKRVEDLERENRELKRQLAECIEQCKPRFEGTSRERTSSRSNRSERSRTPEDNNTRGRSNQSFSDSATTRGGGGSLFANRHRETSFQNWRSSANQEHQDPMRRSAWGMFGFGSIARPVATADGAQGISTQPGIILYDVERYGPPVVDITEEDLRANYGFGVAGSHSGLNAEQQAQAGQEVRPDQTSPIINISPRRDDFDDQEELNEDEEDESYEDLDEEGYQYEDDYGEQYDSYNEDVWDPGYTWTDEEDEHDDRDENENNNASHNNNFDWARPDQSDPNNFDTYSEHATTNTTESTGLNRPAENIVLNWRGDPAFGQPIQREEIGWGAGSSNATPNQENRGQRRPRESGTERDEEFVWRKRPRIDAVHTAGESSGAASVSTVSSFAGTTGADTAPQQGWSLPRDEANSATDGATRRSSRLQGLSPTPSAIPNVAVPLSTAELLNQYTSDSEDDDDSYEPSWDSEDYD